MHDLKYPQLDASEDGYHGVGYTYNLPSWMAFVVYGMALFGKRHALVRMESMTLDEYSADLAKKLMNCRSSRQSLLKR